MSEDMSEDSDMPVGSQQELWAVGAQASERSSYKAVTQQPWLSESRRRKTSIKQWYQAVFILSITSTFTSTGWHERHVKSRSKWQYGRGCMQK
ncbi:hypothetical protein LTS12_022331, partial [Elasticomyces elasticus]